MREDTSEQPAPPSVDEPSARAVRGLRNLVDTTAPWLIDVGSWIFGGVTAVDLVVIAALITVGPVDAAVQTATAALTAAVPLAVAGIVLLRLINDAQEMRLENLAERAFQDAGFPNIDAYFPAAHERAPRNARRSRVALLYAAGLAVVSVVLSLAGFTAAMWHMAPWIAFVLLSALGLSVTLVLIGFAHA